MSGLEALFKPSSIAVVGASRQPGKIGYEILRNIKEYGYGGKVYPVNPQAKEILGFKAYPSISSIPDSIDMVVVSVPAHMVPDVIEEAGKKRAKVAVIISSGFKEIGRHDLEEEVVLRARKYGMRVLGPNIFGVVYTPARMNASFGPKDVIPGHIAFLTQSGALGIALMGMTIVERIGVSAIVSIGNKSDIDDADLLEYLANDEATKVILIYLEGVKEGKRFIDVARKVSLSKPIIVIKAGKTEVGARAVASHTGSLAGNVLIYSTVFKQTGILEARNVEEAFDWARTFSYSPEYRGGDLVVITNGGGAGVLVTDTLSMNGVQLSPPPETLVKVLKPKLPGFASLANPIDVTGMMSNEGYVNAVMSALLDDNIGIVLAVYCQTAVTDPTIIAGELIKEIKELGGLPKPLVVSFIGGEEVYWAIQKLNNAGIPAFPMPERAASATAAVINYYKTRERLSRNA